MASSLAQLFSWSEFAKIVQVTYNSLSWPNFAEDSTVLYDIAVAHSRSDPLSFAIRTSLIFSGVCWFLSMATGTHSWVKTAKGWKAPTSAQMRNNMNATNFSVLSFGSE